MINTALNKAFLLSLLSTDVFATEVTTPDKFEEEIHSMKYGFQYWSKSLMRQGKTIFNTFPPRTLQQTRTRYSISLGTGLANNISLSMEYFKDNDYPISN